MWRFLEKQWSQATLGLLAGRTIASYERDFFTLKTVSLPKTQLAKDLEKLCKEKDGFLTLEEFYQEELYGEHGYYATKYRNVLTNTPPRWAHSMLHLCKLFGYHFFAELGPGDGRLAIMTLIEAEKAKYDLSWGGVEIAAPMREAITQNFKKYGFTAKKEFLVSQVKDMKVKDPCLFIFPYGLDSISPEVFINTSEHLDVPDSLVGVTIEKGILTEIILSPKQLASRGVSIKKGIYDDGKIQVDLSSWKLVPMQRAYIAPKVLHAVKDVVEKLPSTSRLCIIDEFRTDRGNYVSSHLLAPRNLLATERDCVDLVDGYERIGKTDYYFPFYLKSFLGFLKSLGIEVEYVDSEYYAAQILSTVKELPKETKLPGAYSQVIITAPLKGKKLAEKLDFPLDPSDLRTRIRS